MLTVYFLAAWCATGVLICAAFSWVKLTGRRRERERVPWLDRDEEFWTDDEDVAS